MEKQQATHSHKTEGQQQIDVGEARAVSAPVDSRLAQAGANQTSDGIDKHESTTKLWGRWREPVVILTALMVITLTYHGWQFERQWNAMKDSISETRQNRELEYRGYVGIKNVYILPTSPTASDGYVIIVYSNTGRTPAVNLTVQAFLSQRETPIPENVSIAPSDIPLAKVVLPQQVDMNFNVGTVPLNPTAPVKSDMPKLKAQPIASPNLTPTAPPSMAKGQWYIFGVIDYDDIFIKRHRTKFCYYNLQNVFIPCAAHNSFD